jgi:lysophospholipase L1-like esterase
MTFRRLTMLGAVCVALSGAVGAQDIDLAPAGTAASGQTISPLVRKIILVGDSTVSVRSGWGGAFCAFHVTSRIACLDLAREGRSTRSYRAEGSWKIALGEMRSGRDYAATYVLIQFGHNDQPGKPGHSTDLASEFPANLRRYVAEARSAGAIPVLVTPLSRRIFKDGLLQDTLAPWAAAIRNVAEDMRVPVIDLHARSKAVVEALGPVASTRLAEAAPGPSFLAAVRATGTVGAPLSPVPPPALPRPPSKPGGPGPTGDLVFDTTHLGREGADLFAGQVAEELARVFPELRPDLVL